MRESEEGLVRFGNVDAYVLEKALDYVYTGALATDLTFEATRALLLAANMWQMEDLEAAALHSLTEKCDTPARCLKIFLFVREAEETLFACRGADSVAAAVKRDLEQALVRMVRDRWHLVASPTTADDVGDGETDSDDDYAACLPELDLASLKVVLSIKSDQEEVGDFSFSFNQVDLAAAVDRWVSADFQARHSHYSELSEYFCHHQINSQAKESLRALVRRIDDFCSVHSTTPERDQQGETCSSSSSSDWGLPVCRGFWCPHRRISGLVIAHAWSPHPSNRITCDHIFYYFTIPKAMESAAKSRLAHCTCCICLSYIP